MSRGISSQQRRILRLLDNLPLGMGLSAESIARNLYQGDVEIPEEERRKFIMAQLKLWGGVRMPVASSYPEWLRHIDSVRRSIRGLLRRKLIAKGQKCSHENMYMSIRSANYLISLDPENWYPYPITGEIAIG